MRPLLAVAILLHLSGCDSPPTPPRDAARKSAGTTTSASAVGALRGEVSIDAKPQPGVDVRLFRRSVPADIVTNAQSAAAKSFETFAEQMERVASDVERESANNAGKAKEAAMYRKAASGARRELGFLRQPIEPGPDGRVPFERAYRVLGLRADFATVQEAALVAAVKSDERGRYTIPGVALDDYVLVAEVETPSSFFVSAVPVTIDRPEVTTDLTRWDDATDRRRPPR